MERYSKFILHTEIANDMEVCQDLDPSSFWQVQIHSLKNKYIKNILNLTQRLLEIKLIVTLLSAEVKTIVFKHSMH